MNAKNKRVLVIPDTHCPYQHPCWIRFLTAIKEKYLDDSNYLVLHLGDEVDNHAISFHDSDAELYSAGDELEKAIEQLHRLQELFPKMYLCDSNHGSLAVRRFKKGGIPLKYIRTLQEIYQTPKWEWHEDYLVSTKLGPVYFCHGKSSIYGKLCKEVGSSAWQGHYHGKFEITWHHSNTFHRFNIFGGCLVDRTSQAFAYGKNHIPKPILGAGLLSMEGYPRLIKMNLNSKGRWDGKLP